MTRGSRNGTWASVRLSDVTHVVRRRVKPQEHPELPYIGMDNVEAHSMRLLGTVSSWTMKSASVLFLPGDVLYGRLRPYLNKVVTVDFEGLASAEFIPLTVPAGIVSKFIQYRLNASDFVSYSSHLNDGDRPRVDYDQIGAFAFDLPPSSEQYRIVSAIESYFTRLDDAVANLERVQRNLKRYRASVLKAAVEGRLVPTEAELARAEGREYEPASVLLERILAERRRRWEEAELAEIKAKGKVPKDDRWKTKYKEPISADTSEMRSLPEGWCWCSVDQLGDVSGGLTQNSKRGSLELQVPFLRVANVYANELRLDEVNTIGVHEKEVPRVLLAPGDLLVVEGNGSIDQIGRVALWDGSIDPCLHQNHIIKVRFTPVELGKWSLCWFLAPSGRVAIEQVASSTSGLHTLSLSKVGRLPVPLAPLSEQARITAEVDRLSTIALAAANEIKNNKIRGDRLRQTILKWAFEGKLVNQNPIDESSTVLLERIRAERESTANVRRTEKRRRRKAK